MDALKELIKLVRQLGFGVNWNKVVEPTQCLVYLGVKIDTVRGVLSVPAEKCEEMRTTLLNFSQRRRLSKRQLSSLCGKLSWVVQVVHAGSCFLRPLFDLLNALEKPHHKVRVSADTVRILLWWRGALLKLPDFQLWRSCTNGWIIETDASSAGGGAILRNGSGMVDWLYVNWDLDAGGKFKDKHITYKEAIVPLLAMVRWGAFLNDSSVVVYSDSSAAVGMINRGCCRQPELQPLFQTAMLIAVRRGVEVRAFHVPGWYHVFADPCSRLHAVDKMRDFLFRTPDRLSKRCAFILGNAYAPRTKRSYRSQLASWLRFCNSRHLTPLRAEPVHVAEYLAELSTRLSAFRSCQAYANAVSLYFRALGRPDPCESPMVKLVLRGLRRCLSRQQRSREPFRVADLLKLHAHLDQRLKSDIAFWAAVLAAWWGMLRKANVTTQSGQLDLWCDLAASSIVFSEYDCELTVRHSKTNQFGDRVQRVFLPKLPDGSLGVLCPFRALERQLRTNRIGQAPRPVHLFSTWSSAGWLPLTASRFDSRLRSLCTSAGLSPREFTGHGLRRGGATAAMQLGVPLPMIKKLGDWKGNSVFRYLSVRDSDARAAVHGLAPAAALARVVTPPLLLLLLLPPLRRFPQASSTSKLTAVARKPKNRNPWKARAGRRSTAGAGGGGFPAAAMASSASLTPAEAGAPATPAGDSGTSAAPPGADGLAAGSAGDMPARATGPSAEARRTRNQRRNERRRRLRGTAGRPPAEGEPREGEAAVGPKGTTATPAPQDTTPAGEPPSIPATSAAGPSGTAATNYASKVKLQPAVIVFGEEQDLTADELDSAWRTIDAALIDQLLAGRPVSVVKSAKTDGCIFIWCSSEESSRNLRELLPKLNWPKKLGKLVFASEGERQKTQRFRVWIPAGSAIKSGDQLRQILLKLHPDLKVNGLLHHATSRKEKGATVILGLSDDWAKRLPPKSTIHIGLTQLTILRCEERKADEAKNAKASETGTGAQAPPAKKPRQTADPMPGKAVRAAETGNRNRRPARSTRRSGLIQRALDQAKNLRAHRERARASRAPPQQPEGQTLSGEAPTDWFESVTHQEAGATRIDLTDEAEGTGSDSTEARRRGDGNVHAGLTSAEDSTATLTAEDAETPMEINLQHCVAASVNLMRYAELDKPGLILVQEPWTLRGKPQNAPAGYNCFYTYPREANQPPRACIFASKTLSAWLRSDLSNRDICVIQSEDLLPGKTTLIASSIGAWRVLPVSSLSDHKFISFNLMAARSATRVMWRRNARNTDWETFGLALKEFHRSPGQPFTITSCREADECATVLTETLTAAFEASCPLKAYKGKKSAPWWNPELGNLRRRAKRLHRRATKTKSPADQTAYHEAIHEFKRQVRNAKAQKWRQYCEELEGSRPTSRVVKALTLDKMSKLSSVKRTDGTSTDNPGETLDNFIYAAEQWADRCGLRLSETKTAAIMFTSRTKRAQGRACRTIMSAPPSAPYDGLNAFLNIPPLDIFVRREAAKTARRLADAGIRIQPHRAMAKRKLLPHADLCLKDLRDSGGLHVLSDGEPRTLNLFQRYKVTIPSRDAANDHWNFQEVHCYTDGSIKDGRAGFGVCIIINGRVIATHAQHTGRLSTVFQNEVLAISSCAAELNAKVTRGKTIVIHSDSQAALQALCHTTTNSRTVADCARQLNLLARSNTVRLKWIPGHAGFPGNELADTLAKRGGSGSFFGPAPLVPMPLTVINRQIDDWADSLHRDRWAGTQNCRQSRAAVPCPSHRLRNILLNQNRKDIRALVMTLTGHGYLARHCFLRGDLESEICPFCECDNEDAQHFVCHCPFFNRDRLRYLGPNPSIDEVLQMPPKKSAEDRHKSGRSGSPGKKGKDGGQGANSPQEPKKPKLLIWPEFSETEINNEKWAAPQYFDDPDGPLPLPSSLRPEKWKRPQEYFGEGRPVVVVDGENNGYFGFDLMGANEHILHCELVRWIITQVDALFKMHASKATGTEPAEVLVSPDGMVYSFRPWEHIYAINKVVKGPNIPAFNPYGKYVVRLFWLGQWRKIYVDDSLPLDENDNILLPMTARQNELWPMLLTKALIKVAALEKESSEKLWQMLQKLLPEWKLPEPAEKDPTAEGMEEVPAGTTPDVEKQPEQPQGKGKPPGPADKGKGKEDKKEAKASKGDKAKEDTVVYDKPEVAIFASYYDATRRQPLQVTSLADCANKSEQLRQRGFSYLYSHPVQLTKFRVCPLEPPKPPEEIPAWKLIRPKVKRPLPRSEAPDASACGEVGDAVGVTEEKPICAIEVESPFVNYKVDPVPLPQSTSRPTSSLSRRSTRPETPPNPPIDEFDESAPDWDVQEAERRAREAEEARLAAEREAEERRQAELAPGAGEAGAAADKLAAPDSKAGGKSAKTAAAPAAANAPKQQQAAETAGSSAPNITVQHSGSQLDALIESKSELDPSLNGKQKSAEHKKWLDLSELVECFHCIHVYHKVHTYQHRQTHSDLKNIANSGTPAKETRKSAAGAAAPISNSDERSPMFLMVDSLEPTEIIFSMSALCRWPEPPQPVSAPTPTAGAAPQQLQKSGREFTKLSGDDGSGRADTPTAGGEDAQAASAAASGPEPLVPGSFISEFHSWKTLRIGAPFKRLKTTGTKAISLNLPPGRHVLKLFTKAPLGYHCKMVSSSPFNFGTEEDILPLLQKEPLRLKDYASKLMQAVGNIVKNFHEPELRAAAEQEFWRLHCPFHHQKKFDGRKHWEVFKSAFYAMLIKALEGKNPTPDMANAWKTFMKDAVTKNPLQLTFAQKQKAAAAPPPPAPAKEGKGTKGKAAAAAAAERAAAEDSAEPDQTDKMEQDPNSWFNREIGPEQLIAVTRLQKCWRGTTARHILASRHPDGKAHARVQDFLLKAWSFMEPNAESLGLYLLRTLFRLSPESATRYPFSPDAANYLYYHDYSGACQEQPAGGQTFVVFREIFHAPDEAPTLGVVSPGARVLAKMQCTVPTCCLRVINNDDYREFERSLGERMPAQVFKKNCLGYTMIGVAKSPKDQGKWRLRLIGDDKQLLQPSRSDVNSNFATRQLQDYYVPNQRRVIFRQSVRVAEDHLATLHLRLSRPDIAVVLEILDDEEVMLSTEGKGQTNCRRESERKPLGPKPEGGGGGGGGRSPSRGSGRGGGAGKRASGGGRGSARSKEGKLSHASSVSSIAHELTGEFKPHKYIIQARLLDEVWPLTAANWAFVEQLKEQEKEDLKVVGKPKEPTEEAQKLEATVTGSTAGGAAKKDAKGKAAPAKTAGGKDGGKDGKGGGKDGKGGDKKGAAGDPSASRPESATFDERKAHWVLRVISDASQSEEIEPLDISAYLRGDPSRAVHKDYETIKQEEDEIMEDKMERFKEFLADWEKNTEIDRLARNEERKNYMGFVQMLQDKVDSRRIAYAKAITAYRRQLLGDGQQAAAEPAKAPPAVSYPKPKLAPEPASLATASNRTAPPNQSSLTSAGEAGGASAQAKQTDSYREQFFRAREAYRQSCLEAERQRQQELAAKQAEAEAAAAAEAEALKAEKGGAGKKGASKSPRASAKKGKKK
uniref:RNase H domain-containing protein n=1 Tax=Macrostomum lignano TaxID=282301 RepID=A0A1I8FX77_9PLAT